MSSIFLTQLLKVFIIVELPLPTIYEDKNTKKRQSQYHHPGVQQKHGG